MAERLYLGPVSKQLRGNREDALALEREARVKVGYLFDSMAPGQTFKSGSWSVSGGRKIMAFVWNDLTGKRAVVRLVGVGGEGPAAPAYRMESGWLVFSDLETGPEPFVYVWSGADYAVTGPEKTTYNGAVFAGVPAVDETGKYASLVADRDPLDAVDDLEVPDLYSGLARKLVQALVGAGRSIREVLPPTGDFSLTNLPKHLGCVRSAGGEYWLVHASINGVFAAPLTIPDELISLAREASERSRISLEDADFFDSWVLSTVQGSTEAAIELIPSTNAALLTLYYDENATGDDAILEEQYWGWCFTYQLRGKPDEDLPKAITCTRRTLPGSGYIEQVTTSARITFTFPDGGIAGSVEVEETDPWVLGADHTVPVPDGTDYVFGKGRVLFCSRDEKPTYPTYAFVPVGGQLSNDTLDECPILFWYNRCGVEDCILYTPNDETAVAEQASNWDSYDDAVCGVAPATIGSTWYRQIRTRTTVDTPIVRGLLQPFGLTSTFEIIKTQSAGGTLDRYATTTYTYNGFTSVNHILTSESPGEFVVISSETEVNRTIQYWESLSYRDDPYLCEKDNGSSDTGIIPTEYPGYMYDSNCVLHSVDVSQFLGDNGYGTPTVKKIGAMIKGSANNGFFHLFGTDEDDLPMLPSQPCDYFVQAPDNLIPAGTNQGEFAFGRWIGGA